MKQHIDEFTVNEMCRALDASLSDFYAWLKNQEKLSVQSIALQMTLWHRKVLTDYLSPMVFEAR